MLIDVDEDDSSNCRRCNLGAESGGGETSVRSGGAPGGGVRNEPLPCQGDHRNSSGIVSPFRMICSQEHHDAEAEIIVSSLYCSQSHYAAA